MNHIINAITPKTSHTLILLLLIAFFIITLIEYNRKTPIYYKNKDCSEEVEPKMNNYAVLTTNIMFFYILVMISWMFYLSNNERGSYQINIIILLLYSIPFIINMIYTLSYNNYRQIKNGKCINVFKADKKLYELSQARIVICVLLFCLYFYNILRSYGESLLYKQTE
jgi:hypothetical protein